MTTPTTIAAHAVSRSRHTGRPRVLLAPITVTPSKPLAPSHLKGLLWTDVLYRATRCVADVVHRAGQTPYHRTEQTLGFWEFLDRTRGDTGYDTLSEDEIGTLYMEFRASGAPAPAAALRPYAEAAERGWVHPAGQRVLRLWTGHYAELGLHDPGLLRHQPPGLGLEAALERLGTLDMCLDQRGTGGPVYLDLTRYGLPLRQLVTADGRPNYLACALRDLLPLAPSFDEVVLLYDTGLDPDYQLLARVLTALGPRVRRIPVGRVPVDGRIRSARHGGWREHQARTVLAAAREQAAAPAVRLGVRLYFIAVLGPGQHESFRPDLLSQCLRRAERLLDTAGQEPSPAPLAERLARHRKDHVYVDPYRLTSQLLGRRRAAPAQDLLSAVFL
ncbi:hypothetical protein [Streptomyces sp. NRRL F-5135]|uniref:hypothetical protein n=1 Tax=Streptomyces sp. NRRL F-5135 TaxID=1463858 RepID=UPI00068C713C|nr:hypothetical protein [Streptomyces sp. NRRL F-5135]